MSKRDFKCLLCEAREDDIMGILPEANCNEEIRLIQINLKHFRVAQNLLAQATYESEMKIVIISEPHGNHEGVSESRIRMKEQ